MVQIYDIGTRFMIDSGWVVPMQELIDADGWDKTASSHSLQISSHEAQAFNRVWSTQ